MEEIRPDGLTGRLDFGRRSGDKLAILCLLRPGRYLLLRTLATVVALVVLSFVADLVVLLTYWLSRSRGLAYLVMGEVVDDETQADLASSRQGLPLDLARLVLGVVALALVAGAELVLTRGLPPGAHAMRASIATGPPWPGRWAGAVRTASACRPVFAIALTAGLGLAVFGVPHGLDWLYSATLALMGIGVFWGLTHLAPFLGLMLLRLLPSRVDVTSTDVTVAESAREAADREWAERHWPVKQPLRLVAAVRVFAAPPPPSAGRRARTRRVWWTDGATGVETLADELVVQALVEAEGRGWLTLTPRRHRSPLVVALPPADVQPYGLAELVLGRHQEGDRVGRQVHGSLPLVLQELSGTDPHAAVIGLALADLAAVGVARQEGEDPPRWSISARRLRSAAAALPVPPAEVPEVDALRRRVSRALRRRVTSDIDSDNGLRLLAAPFVAARERSERQAFQLPGPVPTPRQPPG